MCEIFGFTSKKEETINEYLKLFFNHCTEHPDGWGIASIKNNEITIKKEALKANDSEFLLNKLKEPIITNNFLAHIRYATMGCMNDTNCHPFVEKDNNGRTWTLIHNGTVFQCMKLNRYIKTQKGETDSERLLLHITNQINKAEKDKKLNNEELFEVLDDIIANITKNNKVNIIFHNGEIMYVHTNLKDTLHYQKTDNHIIFSTLPLNDENWEKVPLNTLISYKNGERLQIGKKHENEYIETEEDLEFLAKLEEEFRKNPCGNHTCRFQ